MPDVFNGFGPETFAFLRGLTEHNEREWFLANRTRYEAHYLAPALSFIEAIGPRLATELPGDVRFDPKVNGSLFRINRDVRFSKDKTPYKNHIDLWFWTGAKKGWETPGYFMRLLPDQWAIGGGIHHLSKEGLMAYRDAVVDERTGSTLEEAVATVDATYDLGLPSLKAVPRGYDASHSRTKYLLYEGLAAVLAGPVPSSAASASFVDECMGHFTAVSPVNQWLASVLHN